MQATEGQTLKFEPLLTVNKVKPRNPPALSEVVKSLTIIRNHKHGNIKTSLVMLLANIHYSNLEGTTTTISYLSKTFHCGYDLLTMRISSLVSLGYLTKHKVYSRHPEKYKMLKFTCFCYSLTKEGIRYLTDMFCKEDI